MTAEKPFIFYSLPKSRTTQQLIGGRKIEKAWNNVSSFLTNCTTANADLPTNISLTAYTAFYDDPNPEIAVKIIEETKQLFGNGQTQPIAYSYPSGVADRHTKTEWYIEIKDLKKAVDYLIKGQPWPKYTFGPVELIISFDFKFIDPTTKTEFSNQEEKSRLLIWLSRNCVCSADLYFPFGQSDSDFHEYIMKIEHYLPFKLEEKYLRFGRINKSKTQYIFTKIKTN